MTNKIKHPGIVESIGEGCVSVRIVQSSACSACKVAGHCHASESKEKIVEVDMADTVGYHVGDRVVVAADTSVGFRASLYGYLLPLLLMVATLVVVLLASRQEAFAALSALAVLIPYYIGLYLFRSRLKGSLSFAIER